jgi:tRNA pseudouridine55 synthase
MDGIILVDKLAGPTSADMVRKVKAIVKPARVGHLGTLDPFATGVLPILIGEATKLAPFLHEGDREYEGVIRLGAETDTLDHTGVVVRTAEAPPLDAARLSALSARFTGIIEQTPPVFSAIKRAGVPLYRLARRGGDVEPPPARRIEIKLLRLEAAGPSSIRFVLICSLGTYVRALARDIGLAIGSAAHLFELRRTRSGIFKVDQARTLDEVLARLGSGEAPGLLGLREALPEMAEVSVDRSSERQLRNGDSRSLNGLVPAGARLFKVVSGEHLVAIAEATSRVTARIVRVFVS